MANTFIAPPLIVSGENALEAAGAELTRFGKKALLVADAMMEKLGNTRKVTEVLEANGIACALFAKVNAEPNDLIVSEGVALFSKEKCDFLIAVGGGSPIDAMKAIGMMAALGGKPADYFGKAVTQKLPPMAAIPTTAGTGSEATQFTIITDTARDVKMLLKGQALLPTLAVVDPRFTMTAPPAVTAATGLDALCHCVEAYTSRRAQPLSDTFALSAAKRIFSSLRTAFAKPDDVHARTEMALAALEAGIAFSNSSVTVIHGMSRPIGALFHVPHGLSNAMLLDVCLRSVADGARGRFAAVARHCGIAGAEASDAEAVERLLAEISALMKELRIQTPREFGIDREKFFQAIPKMTKDAIASGSPGNTWKELDEEAIQTMYRMLWD